MLCPPAGRHRIGLGLPGNWRVATRPPPARPSSILRQSRGFAGHMVSHSRNLFMNIRLTASSLILMAALSACATRVPSTQAPAVVPTPAPQAAPVADAAYPRLPLSNENPVWRAGQ